MGEYGCLYSQSFVVDMPFGEVVSRMDAYSQSVNSHHIDYSYDKDNCAAYVASFLEEALGISDLHPLSTPGDDMKVLGWRNRLEIGWQNFMGRRAKTGALRFEDHNDRSTAHSLVNWAVPGQLTP